jgi:hypothetical protein
MDLHPIFDAEEYDLFCYRIEMKAFGWIDFSCLVDIKKLMVRIV